MTQVIRQVKQPCLAFKILGAGRLCSNQQTVRSAFKFAYDNVKPTDGVIVGMFPWAFDEVSANAQLTLELGSAGYRSRSIQHLLTVGCGISWSVVMREAVAILGAVRTPVGKFGRAFRDVAATRLGALVIDEALRRASIDPREVDEVIMGNVLSAGLGQNPARQAAIHAGLPAAVSAYTVNKVCGSGLKAVMLAAQAVRADDAAIVVAGGMECMSGAPHLIRGARWGVKLGDLQVIDAMISDGLCDAFHRYHMGIT